MLTITFHDFKRLSNNVGCAKNKRSDILQMQGIACKVAHFVPGIPKMTAYLKN